ncbi:hypothetical protein PEPS_10390 [Persicobacter psychrovividus]|uniref:Uncharacterized protein n=1 Tax=Persicobacter psychrovividus TaxID=387638 RepID=A0ABM7VCX9_9BACT|nr:hypothetical protein PEPS_10390 [Persicobacter psychrovividus]
MNDPSIFGKLPLDQELVLMFLVLIIWFARFGGWQLLNKLFIRYVIYRGDRTKEAKIDGPEGCLVSIIVCLIFMFSLFAIFGLIANYLNEHYVISD